MKRPVQQCPKCGRVRKMTIHHIYPKTHFKGRSETAYICRECHNELEHFIEQHEGRNRKGKRNKLPAQMYVSLYEAFIGKRKLNVRVKGAK